MSRFQIYELLKERQLKDEFWKGQVLNENVSFLERITSSGPMNISALKCGSDLFERK